MKKSRTITNHNLAIQHNRLINSRHSLTLSEQKLFLAMVAQIQSEDKAFEVYKIDIKSFAEFTGNNHKEMYGQAKKITRSLLSKVIEIPLPNGDLLQTHFFGHAKYKNGAGYIEVSFYPELKPYLLELKKILRSMTFAMYCLWIANMPCGFMNCSNNFARLVSAGFLLVN